MNLTYEAPGGAWYESPEQYLFLEIMGGCGCGLSDEIAEKAYEVFKHFGTPHAERNVKFFTEDESMVLETLAHWLNSKDLIEHGGSVYGSWLTKKGEELVKILKEAKGE